MRDEQLSADTGGESGKVGEEKRERQKSKKPRPSQAMTGKKKKSETGDMRSTQTVLRLFAHLWRCPARFYSLCFTRRPSTRGFAVSSCAYFYRMIRVATCAIQIWIQRGRQSMSHEEVSVFPRRMQGCGFFFSSFFARLLFCGEERGVTKNLDKVRRKKKKKSRGSGHAEQRGCASRASEDETKKIDLPFKPRRITRDALRRGKGYKTGRGEMRRT